MGTAVTAFRPTRDVTAEESEAPTDFKPTRDVTEETRGLGPSVEFRPTRDVTELPSPSFRPAMSSGQEDLGYRPAPTAPPQGPKPFTTETQEGLAYQWAGNEPARAGRPGLPALEPGPPPPWQGYLPQETFPTQHPYVQNPDGSYSNVKLKGFEFDGREYVIPTMVGGKDLSDEQAVAVAKRHGLEKYPNFATIEEANQWAEANHARIPSPNALPTTGREAPVMSQAEPLDVDRQERAMGWYLGAKRVEDQAKEARRKAALTGPLVGPEAPTAFERGVAGAQTLRQAALDATMRKEKAGLEIEDAVRALIKDPTIPIPFASGISSAFRKYEIRAAQRAQKAGTATGEQMALLDAFQREGEIGAQGATIPYYFASILSQLPAWYGEFAATGPIYKWGAAKVGGKVAKGLGTLAERRAVRLVPKLIGSMSGAALQTGLMPHRIVESYLDREIQDRDPSLLKAFGDVYVEVLSERGGEALKYVPVPKRVRKLRRVIMEEWLKLHPNKSVLDFVNVVKSDFYHGMFGEWGEERLAPILRYAIGLDEELQLGSVPQQIGELAAFGTLGAIGATAPYVGPRAMARRAVEKGQETVRAEEVAEGGGTPIRGIPPEDLAAARAGAQPPPPPPGPPPSIPLPQEAQPPGTPARPPAPPLEAVQAATGLPEAPTHGAFSPAQGTPSEAARPTPQPAEEGAPALTRAKEPWEMTREEFANEAPQVPSGRTAEDIELKPEFAQQVKSVAMKLHGKIIETQSGETNHADIAQRLGFPNDAIPGFVAQDGTFLYQYPDDAHSVEVQEAVVEGKPVPAEVLADYPDLAPERRPPHAVHEEAEAVPGPVQYPEGPEKGAREVHSDEDRQAAAEAQITVFHAKTKGDFKGGRISVDIGSDADILGKGFYFGTEAYAARYGTPEKYSLRGRFATNDQWITALEQHRGKEIKQQRSSARADLQSQGFDGVMTDEVGVVWNQSAIEEIPTPQDRQEDAEAQVGAAGVPVQQVSAEAIAVRPAEMQFKEMDDVVRGINEADELKGDWDDLKGGLLLLWEPQDPAAHGLSEGQRYVLANGHHRFAFGQEQDVDQYNAQIIREADGVSLQDAVTTAAEINIADGKGTVYDQARFIRNTAAMHGEAEARASAARTGVRGRKAASIALDATEGTFTSFINEQITPEQAAAIAQAGPGKAQAQAQGVRRAVEGAHAQDAGNAVRSALTMGATLGPAYRWILSARISPPATR